MFSKNFENTDAFLNHVGKKKKKNWLNTFQKFLYGAQKKGKAIYALRMLGYKISSTIAAIINCL